MRIFANVKIGCTRCKTFQMYLIFTRLHDFCNVGGEKTTDSRKHFVLSPKLKFRQNFKQGAEAINAHSVYMQVVCVLHAAHVYITAWEYCFFTVHLVRAFGDASVLWT